MSRGYDSTEYLEAYRDRRRYPAIHDDIFAFVANRSSSSRYLDLGCCTGLLGQRLLDTGLAAFVLGVERDPRSAEAARAHGVAMPISVLTISEETLPELASLLILNRIDAVVARRCLPEILADRSDLDQELAATLAASGVRQIFLEGRHVSSRSTHRLSCVENEIAALSAFFVPITRRDHCVFLGIKPGTAPIVPRSAPPLPPAARAIAT